VADVAHDILILVCSRTENVDPRNNSNFSKSEEDGLLQTREIWKLLKNEIPGCKNTYPISSGNTIGVRETYHMHGKYFLTDQDLFEGKTFKDVIAIGAYHMDVHSPDTNGLESSFPPIYQIPFSCLVPRDVDNVLSAGRVISANQRAQASTRVIPISGTIGQAAGLAASIAVKDGVLVRNVDIKKLQEILLAHGVYLS
jgi:hypothetical protein